jgi:hypothetical protein
MARDTKVEPAAAAATARRTRRDAALHHTLMDIQAAGLRWTTYAAAAWADRMGAIGAEAVEFAAHRIGEDARLWRQVARCGTVVEAQGIQARFAQKAFEEYADECVRLASAGLGRSCELGRRVPRRDARRAQNPAVGSHPHDMVGEDGIPENVAI